MTRVSETVEDHPVRALFLCTGNSARSQIAQALLSHMGRGRFHVESAGSHPASRVNPFAVDVLRRHGIEWSGRRPRGMDGLETQPWDFVITVCDRARDACPLFPAHPPIAHWSTTDPAAIDGSHASMQEAFDNAYSTLARRIDRLIALPVETMTGSELETRLQTIGEELH